MEHNWQLNTYIQNIMLNQTGQLQQLTDILKMTKTTLAHNTWL